MSFVLQLLVIADLDLLLRVALGEVLPDDGLLLVPGRAFMMATVVGAIMAKSILLVPVLWLVHLVRFE